MRLNKARIGFVLAGGLICALLWIVLGAAQPGRGLSAPSIQGTPLSLPFILKNHASGAEETPTPTPPGPGATPTDTGGVVPQDGSWDGQTHKGYSVSFDVISAGTEWQEFKLVTDFDSANCGVTGTLEVTVPGPEAIASGSFSHDSATYDFSGVFSSDTAAEGTYTFTDYYYTIGIPVPPFTCSDYLTDSGTWTANLQP